MKNFLTLIFISVIGLFLVLGCSSDKSNTSTTKEVAPAANSNTAQTTGDKKPAEAKPVEVTAKNLTKEYEDNELSADGKYKDKLLAVSGKVSNIAETLGNITVSLEGHNAVISVLCSFDEDQKENVMKLKKGQNTTLIGSGDGSTGGLYIGLKGCKIK